jgi:hypothetical protein
MPALLSRPLAWPVLPREMTLLQWLQVTLEGSSGNSVNSRQTFLLLGGILLLAQLSRRTVPPSHGIQKVSYSTCPVS